MLSLQYEPITSVSLPIEAREPDPWMKEAEEVIKEERRYRKFLESIVCVLCVCLGVSTGTFLFVIQYLT